MTGTPPSVSIILPFRNAADTLAAAVDSLRSQTRAAFECVLIDNESRDESAAIARNISRVDTRFRLLQLHGSLVDALNAGIAATTGELIARMDADDLAAPRRLECQVGLFATDPSLSIAGCLVSAFPEETARDGMRRYLAWSNSLCSPERIRAALFVESPLVHPSVMIRRSALAQVGGYASSDGPEDYDLWFRLLLSGHRAAKVQEVLFHWRDTPIRVTRIDPRCTAANLFRLKVRYFPRVVAADTPLQICGAGPIGKRWARAVRSLGYVVRRFIDVDAHKQGRTIAGAPVESLERLDPADGFILAAVGVPGAREQIEAYLQQRGLRPWTDYLAVA